MKSEKWELILILNKCKCNYRKIVRNELKHYKCKNIKPTWS